MKLGNTWSLLLLAVLSIASAAAASCSATGHNQFTSSTTGTGAGHDDSRGAHLADDRRHPCFTQDRERHAPHPIGRDVESDGGQGL